jgi:hypothetical protein
MSKFAIAVVIAALALSLAPAAAQTAAPPSGEDCAQLKQDIQTLQDELANASTQMQVMQQSLDRINKSIATIQKDVKFFSGSGFSESARGDALDQLAKAMSQRVQVEKDIQDAADLIQAIKDEIADLLNKLANCAPPSTTPPSSKESSMVQPAPPPNPAPSSSQTSMSTAGSGIQFRLRGFGGASIINGNTPSSAGFDGAVLFPLGNRVLVGPTAGFEWVDSSIVQSLGGGTLPSTFIHTSAGFKNGNFGARIEFPFGALWTQAGNAATAFGSDNLHLGIEGGVTVASSRITRAEGFCGGTGPTGGSSTTCTTAGTATTHDTVVGPYVGAYISHSIFSHVGVFVGYDYSSLKVKTPTGAVNVNRNEIHVGLVIDPEEGVIHTYVPNAAYTTD